jgi:hypothetical protein
MHLFLLGKESSMSIAPHGGTRVDRLLKGEAMAFKCVGGIPLVEFTRPEVGKVPIAWARGVGD